MPYTLIAGLYLTNSYENTNECLLVLHRYLIFHILFMFKPQDQIFNTNFKLNKRYNMINVHRSRLIAMSIFQVTYETIIFSRYQLFLIESVGVMYFMNGTISLDIHSLFIGALKVLLI